MLCSSNMQILGKPENLLVSFISEKFNNLSLFIDYVALQKNYYCLCYLLLICDISQERVYIVTYIMP